jgi:hypothetical protein
MPETTKNYHRVPTGKRKKKGEKVRTITISKGIKALYDTKNKVIITYLFDKDKYTMKQAKEWVKKSKGSESHDLLVEIDSLMIKREELLAEYRKEVMSLVEDLDEG